MNTIKNALPALISLAQVVKSSINAAQEPFDALRKEESYKDIGLEGDYDSYMNLTMIADALQSVKTDDDISDFMKQELAPVTEIMNNLKEKIKLREETLETASNKFRNVAAKQYENAEKDMHCLVNLDDIIIFHLRITSLSEEQKAAIVERMEEQGFVKVKADSERKYCFLCEVQNQHRIQKIKNYFYKIIEDIVNNPNIKGNFSILKASGFNMVNTLA